MRPFSRPSPRSCACLLAACSHDRSANRASCPDCRYATGCHCRQRGEDQNLPVCPSGDQLTPHAELPGRTAQRLVRRQQRQVVGERRRSGGPGQLPARGSHGSGRAELPHPALRVTGSLRAVAIRWLFVDTLSSLDVLGMLRSNGSVTRHPLASSGSARIAFPAFNGTTGCSESLPPVPPHFVAFVWRYHVCANHFVSPNGSWRRPAGQGVSCRLPLAGL